MTEQKSNEKPAAPFRYDIVGSFLRPEALKEARARFERGEIDRAALTAVEDAEIEKVVRAQAEHGLHAVTDGEFRRKWWHLDYLGALNGVELYDIPSKLIRGGHAQWSYVEGRVSWNPDHPFLEGFRRTREIARRVIGPDALVKQTIPGSGMLTIDGLVLNANYHARPVYGEGDLTAFAEDLAQAYRDAVQAFYEAGVRYLQIDDTSWSTLFSRDWREKVVSAGYDPDELIALNAWITREGLAGKPSDMALTTHICKGNCASHHFFEGSYEKVAREILSIDAYDGFFFEYDDERSGDFQPLRFLKEGPQRAVLGLVTTKSGDMEDPDAVRGRIAEAAKVVPLEQLCLSPQCGFASVEQGNDITEQRQWEKIDLVRDVAKSVWPDA